MTDIRRRRNMTPEEVQELLEARKRDRIEASEEGGHVGLYVPAPVWAEEWIERVSHSFIARLKDGAPPEIQKAYAMWVQGLREIYPPRMNVNIKIPSDPYGYEIDLWSKNDSNLHSQ